MVFFPSYPLQKLNEDSCQGDSGGPLYIAAGGPHGFDVQVGVISWGKGCGREGSYGVNMRVSSYYNWIEGVINEGMASVRALYLFSCHGW